MWVSIRVSFTSKPNRYCAYLCLTISMIECAVKWRCSTNRNETESNRPEMVYAESDSRLNVITRVLNETNWRRDSVAIMIAASFDRDEDEKRFVKIDNTALFLSLLISDSRAGTMALPPDNSILWFKAMSSGISNQCVRRRMKCRCDDRFN